MANTFHERIRHGGFFTFKRDAEEDAFAAFVVIEFEASEAVGSIVVENDEAVLDFVFFEKGLDLFSILGVEKSVESDAGVFGRKCFHDDVVFAPREQWRVLSGGIELFHVHAEELSKALTFLGGVGVSCVKKSDIQST